MNNSIPEKLTQMKWTNSSKDTANNSYKEKEIPGTDLYLLKKKQKTELLIKSLPKQKVPSSNGVIGEFY